MFTWSRTDRSGLEKHQFILKCPSTAALNLGRATSHALNRPTAAERAEQRHGCLQPRGADLDELVARLEQRALCIEHVEQRIEPAAIARVGEIERRPRLPHRFFLQA